MSEPDDENPTPSDWSIDRLEACDEALARGQSPREADAPGDAEDETLDLLRRLDGLRDREGAPGGQSDIATTIEAAPDPATIGRFTVLRRLGEGGFGRVYLAHDAELRRDVAIKVPTTARATGRVDAAAYLAEARILAQLDHPHIVPVHDFGRTEDDLCYVVSKYIEGSDLADRIRQGRPSFRESAELVAIVAEALHHAHRQGLVHRDIKPANILLDLQGRPWVADFGLALKDEDFGKGARIAGTPAYMSPEQARGEGHRVDGRSDIFSLGVVLYELLTGRRPFRGDSFTEVMALIAGHEPRPPRQIDDTIPKELERVVLKALSKRATERYTTARDLADDLRHFLQAEAAAGPPARGPVGPAPVAKPEATPTPRGLARPDSDVQAVKIIPKGLRSFDQHDAEFYLELLPGPRDREGLPDSLRFWKTRIEAADPDATLKVGLIYGPSGCGKSSLVKAGLLPRLAGHVRTVYVEATAEETEARLLRGLRKACPEQPGEFGLVDSLAQLRRGRILPPGRKVLVVLDQFEQWLFARRAEENTELIAALRHCDGEHVQAVVLVRDDFWLAASRFMRDLEIRLLEGENSTLVDLFAPRHARKVLIAFGRADGALPDKIGDLDGEQKSFLDRSISGLAQDGKVISVRLALFAEMMKGKPWTPATLREMGGAEGVGLTFLEETFSAATAPPEHRLHQKAAQAVLMALLPESGTDIKGQMRSRRELLEASGYAHRPGDFDDLIRILDPELRLITPTDPEGTASEDQHTTASGQYYVLSHDYLVPSLRDWLTRKQRETRRGRAELRLAERSSLWNAKPENRHLPSALEWANIRLLTKRKDWTEPERRMMRRAGRVHRVRGVLILALLIGAVFAGTSVRRRVIEDRRATEAAGLVQRLLDADTPQVPEIVGAMRGYRRRVDAPLRGELDDESAGPREKLHASLALLPVDAAQVDYLFGRLSGAAPGEFPVLREALRPHRSTLSPRLWTVLESAKPGDPSLLPAAGALASYDPDDARWDALSGKVSRALVSVNAVYLGSWLDALRPMRSKLTPALAALFQDRSRPETEHTLATNILADYAGDDPDRLAELLMVSDPKAYVSLFPVAEKRTGQVLPIFRAELGKRAAFSWNDPPLDPSWTNPDASLVSRIESAQGMLSDRFGFCQTMALDEFLTAAESLRKSGYRPVRFRPFADEQVARVAAVWTRDGRPWRICSGLTNDEVRQQDERNRKDRFLPVDVAGYVTVDGGGKPADRYAALWVEESGDDDARMYAGLTSAEETAVQGKLRDEKLIPRILHAMSGPDDQTRYCGIWGRPPATASTGQTYRDLFEGDFEQRHADLRDFEQRQTDRGDQSLRDVVLSKAGRPRAIRERARAALEAAEEKLQTRPDDLDSRLSRAMAHFRLGEDQKALDDLLPVIGKDPESIPARRYRVIALARLGRKRDALTELTSFQKGTVPESSRLSLATVVAAELGEGVEKQVEVLEAAIGEHPEDADLRSDAARAFSLASRAVSRSDRTRGRRLAERCLQLLGEAVRDGDADFGRMDEDADLDPIRDDPAFAEIMKAGHPDRRYAAVWSSDPASFEAIPVYGLDPAAHLQKCRGLAAQGHRPVSWSVARTTPEGPPVAASVWHRPVVGEELKDRLAERQARAAVALVRMGQSEEVWSLLRHSTDPRLRSFIINWLNPLGTDPALIAAECDRVDPNARPNPAPGQQKMDAILFHPESSIRRALILALGTYGTESLSPGEREPLIGKLLDLYRSDPDAGIHGAAEWTLRKWRQQDQVMEVDAQLAKVKDWGERRWYINGQGQTFAVIEGPVEFRMGDPATDPERIGVELTVRRIGIPRRFAIATKEVTVEQFRRFGKLAKITNDPFLLSPSGVIRYSPDPQGPWVAPDWYVAAHYCNWLSEQEGVPRDQWCYLPNEAGAYAEGMSIPADVLERTGYRLPTEAEWEYACRAGAATSRYYGASIDLLVAYAWYQANSKDHARACGSLLPNDLGLFDMLGNQFEWTQSGLVPRWRERKGVSNDIINIDEYISEKSLRVSRGGSYTYRPAAVRSADRHRNAPAYRNPYYDFRPSRTYK